MLALPSWAERSRTARRRRVTATGVQSDPEVRFSLGLGIVVLATALLLGAVPARAATSALDPTGAFGAPSWVVPGTRITYDVATASVAGGYDQLVEDPAAPLTPSPCSGSTARSARPFPVPSVARSPCPP
jgi:hypothetical protein